MDIQTLTTITLVTTLIYLQVQTGMESGENPEPCPICQRTLGKKVSREPGARSGRINVQSEHLHR